MDIILKAIPLILSLYLYIVPKVLIRPFINRYIEHNFSKYTNEHMENEDIKKSILNIVSFITFLVTYGGIIISTVCNTDLKWTPSLKVDGVIFLALGMFLLVKYLTGNLDLRPIYQYLEIGGLAIAFAIILCHSI